MNLEIFRINLYSNCKIIDRGELRNVTVDECDFYDAGTVITDHDFIEEFFVGSTGLFRLVNSTFRGNILGGAAIRVAGGSVTVEINNNGLS